MCVHIHIGKKESPPLFNSDISVVSFIRRILPQSTLQAIQSVCDLETKCKVSIAIPRYILLSVTPI